MKIEQPHGYLLDSDGNVIKRFGNWSTEKDHQIPPEAADVEYVDGPTAHTRPVAEEYQRDI